MTVDNVSRYFSFDKEGHLGVLQEHKVGGGDFVPLLSAAQTFPILGE